MGKEGPLLELKGLAKLYSTAGCDLENPTERVGMPSIGKLWQGKKENVSDNMKTVPERRQSTATAYISEHSDQS